MKKKEQERIAFELIRPLYSSQVRVNVMNPATGELSIKNCEFSLRGEIDQRYRTVYKDKLRTKRAVFFTSEAHVIEGLRRSTAYGKTFIQKGDKQVENEDGELGWEHQLEPFAKNDLLDVDVLKSSLINLADGLEVEINPSWSSERILKQIEKRSPVIISKTGNKNIEIPTKKDDALYSEEEKARERLKLQNQYISKFGKLPDGILQLSTDLEFLHQSVNNPDFDREGRIKAREEMLKKDTEENVNAATKKSRGRPKKD